MRHEPAGYQNRRKPQLLPRKYVLTSDLLLREPMCRRGWLDSQAISFTALFHAQVTPTGTCCIQNMNQGSLHGMQGDPLQVGVALLSVKTQLALLVVKNTKGEGVFVVDEAFGGRAYHEET